MISFLDTLSQLPILPVHIGILCLTALAILLADHDAFTYFRGTKQVLDRKKTMLLHRLVWIGLLGMIATGFLLFWPTRDYLLSGQSPTFFKKMFFVAVLAVNALFIGRLMNVAFERSFAALSKNEKFWLFASGAISTICWLSAAACAFYIF
ncbi:hypothetical protein K8Q93_03585 [Candidatus Parcubacteria bacterium]|nr:hypothetical protein [Candidatus Parcubacteria bacterium]